VSVGVIVSVCFYKFEISSSYVITKNPIFASTTFTYFSNIN
jgi:hypothetical protein